MPFRIQATTVSWLPSVVLPAAMTLYLAVPAHATELTLAPTLCGHDEREQGAGSCLVETAFKAGVPSADLHLKVGGESAGCDSEWAASFEFDLGALPSGAQVYGATLIVRKTGYSDDSQGFAYLGAFGYEPSAGEVTVERADLTPETALDIRYPSAANTDLAFDVTAALQDLVSRGGAKAGLMLAPVYSEIGYEDWISVGGCGYAVPPRLVVVHEGAVRDEPSSWSRLKANYR